MRRNVIIIVSVILTTVVLYLLFRGKDDVKAPGEVVVQESQPALTPVEPEEEVGEEVDSEITEKEDVDDANLEERKLEYLKTLDKIDKYFSERVEVLRNEIAKLSNGDPKRAKMEQELERIEKEYASLKQEISKMKSEVETKGGEDTSP